jgi:hypothetical protein
MFGDAYFGNRSGTIAGPRYDPVARKVGVLRGETIDSERPTGKSRVFVETQRLVVGGSARWIEEK